MEQFIYKLTPVRAAMLTDGPDDAEAAVLNDHLAYLKRLAARGVVKLAGRTQTTGPETFGVCIFEAADEPAAAHIMAEDPAIKGGVMNAELFPFRIALQG